MNSCNKNIVELCDGKKDDKRIASGHLEGFQLTILKIAVQIEIFG